MFFKTGALLALFVGAVTLFTPAPVHAQVVVLVNGAPITAYDIQQRGRLMQLSNRKTPSREEIINELIDDKLKLNVARRYGMDVTDGDVENQFASLARNMRATPDQFSKSLSSNGVNPNTLKSKLRSDIAWAQIVRGKFQSSLQVGERDIALALQQKNEEKDVGHEYTLTPILFVVPRGSSDGVVEARKREAEAFRARFQNCDQGISFARGLRDVVVRETIRRNSADMPEALRSALDKIEVGKLAPPEVTPGGVEVFAICDKRETSADTPAKRAVREQMFADKFQTQAKRYLKELRKGAMIEYRN